jgi:hypothetical protein
MITCNNSLINLSGVLPYLAEHAEHRSHSSLPGPRSNT